MKPTVGDDMDQGGNVVNRESPNRYRKSWLACPQGAGARAVYGGIFSVTEKPIMYTPDGPHGGDGKLSHMLHPPPPIKSCQEVELLPMKRLTRANGSRPSSVLTPPKKGSRSMGHSDYMMARP